MANESSNTMLIAIIAVIAVIILAFFAFRVLPGNNNAGSVGAPDLNIDADVQ